MVSIIFYLVMPASERASPSRIKKNIITNVKLCLLKFVKYINLQKCKYLRCRPSIFSEKKQLIKLLKN